MKDCCIKIMALMIDWVLAQHLERAREILMEATAPREMVVALEGITLEFSTIDPKLQ